jgi:hypothetical protein
MLLAMPRLFEAAIAAARPHRSRARIASDQAHAVFAVQNAPRQPGRETGSIAGLKRS